MRKFTRIVALVFGLDAGIAGLEHGYFEILQGNTKPDSMMIASMGPPCVPEKVWNLCEPAMTIVPNFLITGILAVILGLLILVWSLAFVQRKHGGVVLILLSVALLLFGGGLFPPIIGVIGGIAGISINKPIKSRSSGSMLSLVSRLWPWPLVIFMLWVWGQFLLGYFFNDFLQGFMGLGILLILVMLPLSVYTAYARDVQNHLQNS